MAGIDEVGVPRMVEKDVWSCWIRCGVVHCAVYISFILCKYVLFAAYD